MLFDAPISFDAALDSRAVKALLPTEASARELQRLPAELRERSVFSARTRYASHLAQIDRIVNQVLDPRFVYDPHTGGKRAAAAGESMSIPKARELLRASLDSLGYDPAGIDAVPGSLKDLRSFARLNLIIDTNVKMARGYGQWAQGQSAGILDEWPAQELYRLEARENERDWLARWRAAGGRSFGGRMIALKNDPIWTEISAFGLPYPPFDYNSGMDVRDVDRAEAMQLRLIDRDTEIAPASRGFNEDLQTNAPFDPALQPELAASIQQAMGDAVELEDGVLRFRKKKASPPT